MTVAQLTSMPKEERAAWCAEQRRPTLLAIDLFCGLGGWTDGLLTAGYRVVGFDIQRHEYGEAKYPVQLILQDILTLHGSQFRDAALIVASPPCQNYSYLAMPWSRSTDPENSKAAKALRKKWETEGPDNRLFDACFRIQREASEAAGRYIPMIVENVRGAQPWVGRSRANYGSFFLWGDVAMIGNRIQAGGDIGKFGAGLRVPKGSAIKQPGNNSEVLWRDRPVPRFNDGESALKVPGFRFDGSGRSFQTASVESTGQKRNPDGTDHPQGSWFRIADSSQGDRGLKTPGRSLSKDAPAKFGTHNMGSADKIFAELAGTKIGGDWFSDPKSTCRKHGSRSNARKAASAMIAKIPLPLSEYIARTHFPR